MSFDIFIYSSISSGILFRHLLDIRSDIFSDNLSEILFDISSDILCDILARSSGRGLGLR